VDEKKLSRIMEVFSDAQPITVWRAADSPGIIFIVGLPRSGTTLLERILTRLDGVVSNGETENFSRALFAEASAQAADAFARAAGANFDRVGRGYVKLASHPASVKVIEKLPLNYLYLGPIRRALPAASAILLNREPLDVCFAMFRTLFGEAYPFTYDFTDLARYYAAYARLINHWRTVLGGWLIETHYEKLVSLPAQEGARIARATGLDWDPSAIEIHRSGGVSMTASASQIRRQIYQSSVGKWRHYRGHLTPLIAALRSNGVAIADTDG
jgi:Sulfotransferase family